MEPADNGIVISYEKTSKPKNGKTFDGPCYKQCTEVFEIEKEEPGEKPEPGEKSPDQEAFDSAFARYRELWTQMYKQKKS